MKNNKRHYIILVFSSFGFLFVLHSQNNFGFIKGEVSGQKRNSDSVYFEPFFYIAKDYFEITSLSSEINDNKFLLNVNLTYPHMLSVGFKSEIEELPFGSGEYFIDSSTNYVKIASIGECSIINGKTHNEYINRFIPFFYTDDNNCKSYDFQFYKFENASEFDVKLLDYVIKYPNSYVALWYLIDRFSLNGYSKLYEDILFSFSPEIKEKKIWKVLFDEINGIRVKLNQRFPNYDLKDVNLNSVKINFPDAKFILIDYWFSNCRPCIEGLPELKRLYTHYNSKGFEIISISTDKSRNIRNWQNLIKEKGLNWVQYLDENAHESNRDKIIKFPTFLMLNSEKVVVDKGFSLSQLEAFLLENL